ncbi:MAG TPA: DUF6602 domain-containing protein [Dehalococcoidia bacterium]|nr:DUF6602 domain-containing protein [Dehalococcoidia bacterium]
MAADVNQPWRDWMRKHSNLLVASFEASAGIKHTGTKGSARETQVIDVFQLLPQRVTPYKNVVIMDSTGTESPKFDGAILDRRNLPLLAQVDDALIAMVESVEVCIEVKSNLDKGDLEDMFAKCKKLRAMKLQVEGQRRPMMAGIAYKCENTNLRYFDYATAFWESPAESPMPVCVLGQAVFAAGQPDTDDLIL